MVDADSPINLAQAFGGPRGTKVAPDESSASSIQSAAQQIAHALQNMAQSQDCVVAEFSDNRVRVAIEKLISSWRGTMGVG